MKTLLLQIFIFCVHITIKQIISLQQFPKATMTATTRSHIHITLPKKTGNGDPSLDNEGKTDETNKSSIEKNVNKEENRKELSKNNKDDAKSNDDEIQNEVDLEAPFLTLLEDALKIRKDMRK